MSDDPQLALEEELRRDLEALEQRFADEQFSSDLYRALSNNVWQKRERPEGALALSWNRAEALVNSLREHFAQPVLTLAQTGGEGEVADVVADELGRLGWTREPLDTSRHDERHLSQPELAPATGGGAEWEQLAHDEADEYLREHPAKRTAESS